MSVRKFGNKLFSDLLFLEISESNICWYGKNFPKIKGSQELV